MKWVLALIFAGLGYAFGEEAGMFAGLSVVLLVGWLLEREQRRARFVGGALDAGAATQRVEPGSFELRASARIVELTERVSRLERELASLRAAISGRAAVTMAETATSTPLTAAPDAGPPQADAPSRDSDATLVGPTPIFGAVEPTATPLAREPLEGGHPLDDRSSPRGEPQPSQPAPAQAAPAVATPSSVDAAVAALRELLFGGNTVVRIGVLVLITGLGLLAKFAADHSYLPLELRLAFAALVGTALIVGGFRLRARRPGFATALQGGGVAALYLVTFFSFYAYALLPVALTLPLLIAIAALSAVLALAQNAQQLAVFGALGGFLAPILASRGGSHIALFSYYALLNGALVGIALFRAWRVLNWTGFLFTFGVGAAWGALRFEPAHMVSAGAFLALFFALYVGDATLFALRQPDERRGTIDTTLTFGTPLATLALAGGLFQDTPLYLALACAAMAAVYLGTARWLLARGEEALRTLARAYVAIGIGVATLAIPFALESALATALAWGVEASGLVWVGAKQGRLRTRIAGYALFVLALFALLARIDHAGAVGRPLYCVLMALTLGFAAGVIDRHRAALRDLERYVGHVLFGLGLFVWLGALHLSATADVLHAPLEELTLLTLFALSVIGFELVGARTGFATLRTVAPFVLPYLLLNLPVVAAGEHPFARFAWCGWLAAIAAGYWALWREERAADAPSRRGQVLHASGGWLIALLLAIEARFYARDELSLAVGFVDFATLIAPLALIGCIVRGVPRWPARVYQRTYRAWTAWPLALVFAGFALLRQLLSDGSAHPLPYLPLVNPLDLGHALLLSSLLALRASAPRTLPLRRKLALALVVGSAFVALNATVVRTAYVALGAPFEPLRVPDHPMVQATFSIMWTVLALIAMLLAHRRGTRGLWIAGAALLAAVVLKLFLLDLAQLGGIAKIVTFLAVGSLLLAIGYFAPVPPSGARAEGKEPT